MKHCRGLGWCSWETHSLMLSKELFWGLFPSAPVSGNGKRFMRGSSTTTDQSGEKTGKVKPFNALNMLLIKTAE